MKIVKLVGAVCALGLLSSVALAKKGDGASPDPAAAAAMAQASAVSPQHRALLGMVGSWDAAGTMWLSPGKPPIKLSTKATVKAVGDLWIVEDVVGTFMGQPFFGHSVTGYDATKKKFVANWVDNFGSFMVSSEGTADASNKVITSLSNEVDPTTGKSSVAKTVLTIDSPTKHTSTMYKTGSDGKETKVMEMVYTKSK